MLIFQASNDLQVFKWSILPPKSLFFKCFPHSSQLLVPFAKTAAYFNSFLLSTTRLEQFIKIVCWSVSTLKENSIFFVFMMLLWYLFYIIWLLLLCFSGCYIIDIYATSYIQTTQNNVLDHPHNNYT